MSTQPVATLPDEQTATNNLYDGLHNHIYFQKLAAAGHSPQGNIKRAQAMLELGLKLEALETEELQKAGADLNDPYCAANSRLDEFLTANGLGQTLKTAAAVDAERSIDDLAARCMQDPTLYNSALRVKASEADNITAWLNQQAAQAAKA